MCELHTEGAPFGLAIRMKFRLKLCDKPIDAADEAWRCAHVSEEDADVGCAGCRVGGGEISLGRVSDEPTEEQARVVDETKLVVAAGDLVGEGSGSGGRQARPQLGAIAVEEALLGASGRESLVTRCVRQVVGDIAHAQPVAHPLKVDANSERRTRQLCGTRTGGTKISSTKIGITEIGSTKIGSTKIGSTKICSTRVGGN